MTLGLGGVGLEAYAEIAQYGNGSGFHPDLPNCYTFFSYSLLYSTVASRKSDDFCWLDNGRALVASHYEEEAPLFFHAATLPSLDLLRKHKRLADISWEIFCTFVASLKDDSSCGSYLLIPAIARLCAWRKGLVQIMLHRRIVGRWNRLRKNMIAPEKTEGPWQIRRSMLQ